MVTKAKEMSTSFSLENELSKIEILVPLIELLKNYAYKESFMKLLQPITVTPDTINIQDDKPTNYFGPHLIEKNDNTIPPFYVYLNVHDKLLHNFPLDFGVSHNLIPKRVMGELGLDITKSYHDLYSIDSKNFKCLGIIKELVVTLA